MALTGAMAMTPAARKQAVVMALVFMVLLRLQIDYSIFWVLQTAGKLEHGRGSVNAG